MDTTDVRPDEMVTTRISTIGDACASCGAALQPDQRYCVECGVRNAPPRLAFMDGRTRPQTEPSTAAPAASTVAEARRPASGMTLIAGVATLLVALGVGVLIGDAGSNATTPAGSRVQIVSVPAAAPAAAAPAAGTTTTSTTPAASTAGAGTARKAAKKAASTSSAKKTTAPKPVKVGSKGHGPGYTNGKFTGNFFGP